MRTESVFCAECVCGRYFETESREFICPNCNRVIVLEWGITDNTTPELDREKKFSEVGV